MVFLFLGVLYCLSRERIRTVAERLELLFFVLFNFNSRNFYIFDNGLVKTYLKAHKKLIMIYINIKRHWFKLISTSILILICYPVFSQDLNPEILDKIFEGGESFTAPLKNGQIESLRKVKPGKDTWLFSKLEEYQRNLSSKNIIYGQIIMPNKDESSYSYNLFAYDIKEESYYFVAIVSFKILENDVKINGSYLFTEDKSLKNWWYVMLEFYKSENVKKIPKKYIYQICPPSPFRE